MAAFVMRASVLLHRPLRLLLVTLTYPPRVKLVPLMLVTTVLLLPPPL